MDKSFGDENGFVDVFEFRAFMMDAGEFSGMSKVKKNNNKINKINKNNDNLKGGYVPSIYGFFCERNNKKIQNIATNYNFLV